MDFGDTRGYPAQDRRIGPVALNTI